MTNIYRHAGTVFAGDRRGESYTGNTLRSLIWKTDWGPNDNYAIPLGSETRHIARLENNYLVIRDWVVKYIHSMGKFELFDLRGIMTIPFADFLNRIESDLEAIHEFPVSWIPLPSPWVPGGGAPTYEDINRWEKNGEAIADYAIKLEDSFRFCGEVISGDYFTV